MGYTHGNKWSDELIKAKIMEVVNGLELSRMPSKSECEAFFRDSALTNAISKRKSWYALADELNLPVKESETFFGKKHEVIAGELLMSVGFEVRQMSQNYPYDILVDNCIKVDVKVSRLYHGKSGNFYSFNLEKPYATCDFFLLYAIADNKSERIFVVPSKTVIAQKQISIGEMKSKYQIYENALNLIEEAVNFWNSVR